MLRTFLLALLALMLFSEAYTHSASGCASRRSETAQPKTAANQEAPPTDIRKALEQVIRQMREADARGFRWDEVERMLKHHLAPTPPSRIELKPPVKVELKRE